MVESQTTPLEINYWPVLTPFCWWENQNAQNPIICFLLTNLSLGTSKNSKIKTTINGSFVADYRGGDTSVSKQLALILKHPFAYLEVLKNTMFKEFVYKFFGIYTIGSFAYLGNVSSNCYLVYLIYLIVLACSDKSSYHISVKERFSILFVLLCTILLIWTALYLAFTPVGNSSIGGVQGRYFIPIMYALYLCFSSSSKKNVKNGFNDLLIVFVPIFVLSFVVYSLLLVPFCI